MHPKTERIYTPEEVVTLARGFRKELVYGTKKALERCRSRMRLKRKVLHDEGSVKKRKRA